MGIMLSLGAKDTAELCFLMKLGGYEFCLQSPAREEGKVPSEEASARC